MSKYLTKSVAATISALLLLGCAAPAFAADATVEKKETSYLILNADGSVQEQITSDWLHSDDGFDAVTDESDLSDIQNLKSDVMPEQSGNTLKWTTDETDIYYQGKNSAQAPVGVSIEYTLTGALYNAENPADTDTVVGAANAISDGAAKLGSGASQLATGTSAFATGVGTLDAGTNQLLGGMETLSSSSKTVSNAIGQFQTGGAELKDGTSELSDGMTEFSDTINDKLDGLSEITDPDSTLARVIDIMKNHADSFKGSGSADGTDMTVSYVMRTATDSSSNSTSTTEETTTETETKDSFWNRVANLFSK